MLTLNLDVGSLHLPVAGVTGEQEWEQGFQFLRQGLTRLFKLALSSLCQLRLTGSGWPPTCPLPQSSKYLELQMYNICLSSVSLYISESFYFSVFY